VVQNGKVDSGVVISKSCPHFLIIFRKLKKNLVSHIFTVPSKLEEQNKYSFKGDQQTSDTQARCPQ